MSIVARNVWLALRAARNQLADRRRPGIRVGLSAVVPPNYVLQKFDGPAAIRRGSLTSAMSGFKRVACLCESFPTCRQVGGAPSHRPGGRELAMNGRPRAAVWRSHPDCPDVIHSDLDSQFSSHDRQDFAKPRGLVGNMSRRVTVTIVLWQKAFPIAQTQTDPWPDLSGPGGSSLRRVCLHRVLL